MNRLKILSPRVKDCAIKFLFLACLFFGFSFSQTVSGQNPPEATILELNNPLTREIAGGENHSYRLTLSANQYAKVTVEQRGIDLAVRLESESGKIIETDFDPRKTGIETVEFTANDAESFTITVRARQKNAEKGFYQIKIEEIRAASEKDFALDEARRLNSEATRLWFVDKYDEALPLARRSVEIREKELGGDHPDLGTSLLTLANQYNDLGDYPTAETLYLRALAIKEKAFGKDDISLAVILNNLGIFYQKTGDYVKAETVFERALKIREKNLEPNHLSIASVLINLGNLSRKRGDWLKAASYYRRVLEIRENALGPEHPEVAVILNNLGNLYSDNDPDISKSEPFYLRALQIREKVFEPDNPQIAQTLFNLAVLYGNSANLNKALSFAKRSLAIFEKSLGAEHPLTALNLNLLGAIYTNIGDYSQAETFYLRSIAIKRKKEGEYHPYLGGIYSNLAGLYALKGDIEKAIAEQKRANSIIEFNTGINLTTGSERQKLEYLKTLREFEDKTLTLGFQFAPESKEAAALSATMILQRKGRVLDAVSDNINALRRRFNSQDKKLLDDLAAINKDFAELISGDNENLSAEQKQAEVEKLSDQREKLESEISRRANGFYERTKPVTLPDVQSVIPADGVLLEFTVYRPASMSSISGYDQTPPHYAVFVVRPDELKWKDLGETDKINQAIDAFRRALRDPKRKDIRQTARGLDEKLMSPIRALIGDKKHLLVSPDGNLNLIPFEALVDENGKFLIENYAVTYLTAGRDLLRMKTSRESKDKALVVANPSFDQAGLPIAANTRKANTRRNTKRISIAATRNLSDTYFAPLSGTAQEARAIQTLFPESKVLTEAEATESALKQINAPQILHIATHGFFLEDSGVSKEANAESENPLLRSGLALAGANSHGKNGTDDGILTALEASGLNLWGTKLVVLSACDTGLGVVKNGEGVYGLRRAFLLAGTESLVMSLWSVSDYVTREVMTGYYKNLKQGAGRSTALREVQLEMLKKPNRQHPFYWASFIQSGEWANLDGRR